MLAVMSGDGSMSCLGLDGLAIGADQYTGHHPERSKAYKHQQQIHTVHCCIYNLYMYSVQDYAFTLVIIQRDP